MVAVARDSLTDGAPGRRIGMATLLQAAMRRARQAWLPLTAAFVVGAAANSVLELGVRALHLDVTGRSFTPGFLGYVLVMSFATAALATVALRLLLGGWRGRSPINAGLTECAGLLAMANAAFIGSSPLYSWLVTWAVTASGDANWTAVVAAVGLGLYLLLALAMIRLVLWPVGRLEGRQITPQRSWRLMRKATRGFVLATLVAIIPIGLLAVGGLFAMGGVKPAAQDAPTTLVLSGVVSAAWTIANSAIMAAVYGLRVQALASVAAVFD